MTYFSYSAIKNVVKLFTFSSFPELIVKSNCPLADSSLFSKPVLKLHKSLMLKF